jgi:hypothetical protein
LHKCLAGPPKIPVGRLSGVYVVMKNLVVLFALIASTSAFAGGSAPTKIDCDRDTYRHFLEQGNYVLSIEDEKDFRRHWEGFVNRANTEWREALLNCGYDPQDLRDNLKTVRAQLLMESVSECRKDAGEFRQKDYDRCERTKGSHKECLDRADKNFREHLNSCGFRDGSAMLGKFGERAGININIGGGGGKCDGGSCSK